MGGWVIAEALKKIFFGTCDISTSSGPEPVKIGIKTLSTRFPDVSGPFQAHLWCIRPVMGQADDVIMAWGHV